MADRGNRSGEELRIALKPIHSAKTAVNPNEIILIRMAVVSNPTFGEMAKKRLAGRLVANSFARLPALRVSMPCQNGANAITTSTKESNPTRMTNRVFRLRVPMACSAISPAAGKKIRGTYFTRAPMIKARIAPV
jgi:hypothetical protein